jgi:hypothetical protein
MDPRNSEVGALGCLERRKVACSSARCPNALAEATLAVTNHIQIILVSEAGPAASSAPSGSSDTSMI